MTEKTNALVRNYSELNYRLSTLMKAKEFTMQTLANKARVAIGTIQKLMTDPTCNPTIASLEAISAALNISLSELLGQKSDISSVNNSNIFLLEWEEVPCFISSSTEINSKKAQYIKTSCTVGKNAFALKAQDNSMLPLFPENSILIFDPEKVAKDGNYVIVQIQGCKNVIFKQLLIDEPYKYVKSINPLFKDNITRLDPTDRIIAALVQAQMQY